MFGFAEVVVEIRSSFSLEYWLRIEWYSAVPLGIHGYPIVRYSQYFAGGRRGFKRMIDCTCQLTAQINLTGGCRYELP